MGSKKSWFKKKKKNWLQQKSVQGYKQQSEGWKPGLWLWDPPLNPCGTRQPPHTQVGGEQMKDVFLKQELSKVQKPLISDTDKVR